MLYTVCVICYFYVVKYKAVIHTSLKAKITIGIEAETMEAAKKQLGDTLRDDYLDRDIYISSAEICEASNPKNVVHYAIGWFEAIRRYGKP